MTKLKEYLQTIDFNNVITYINSGNIILESNKQAKEIRVEIEKLFPEKFKLDSEIIKVLVLSKDQIISVVNDRPNNFGDHPDTYHSDVIFLMDIDDKAAFDVFSPKEGVDDSQLEHHQKIIRLT